MEEFDRKCPRCKSDPLHKEKHCYDLIIYKWKCLSLEAHYRSGEIGFTQGISCLKSQVILQQNQIIELMQFIERVNIELDNDIVAGELTQEMKVPGDLAHWTLREESRKILEKYK